MSDQHQRFLERLAGSRAALFLVARIQHEKGHAVEIAPIRFAPTAAEAPNYLDAGDLFLRSRVEVKGLLNTAFTGADDWPHPHVFVSSVEKVDRSPDALAYVLVSRDFAAYATIRTTTKPKWYVHECVASNTGNLERYYCCPIGLVKFEIVPPEWR